MINGLVIVFLALAAAFAVVHTFALAASLYWYYWWFDIVMHFWGGMLTSLGVHALSTFSRAPFRPTLSTVLLTLFIVTVSWEVFEWLTGLWQPEAYLVDTIHDLLLGFGGGLLAHLALRTYTMKRI